MVSHPSDLKMWKDNSTSSKEVISFSSEDGYKTFSIRVKDELLDKINDIASKTGHSRNELIGQFLEYAIAHCTIADK